MGKNHKHKKQLKSEKSKIKLKANKLPKGGNVTDTNFKIKKIIIKEQLKSGDSGRITSKRKLNINDLISRLHHYNPSARNDALSGLREILGTHSTVLLSKNLHLILESVAKLSLDQDKAVRRESFKVLHLVLGPVRKLVAQVKIAPFFDILASYLCCAMTHINPMIQEDALLFLDVLIVSFPNLVAKYSQKILPSFLDLISKLKCDSAVNRNLTIKMHGKQTSVKWRIKVLQRLHDLLKAIVQNRTIPLTVHSPGNDSCSYEKSQDKFFPVVRSNFVINCSLSTIFATSFADKDEEKVLKNYASSLMPLLLESWLEIKPNIDEHRNGSLITEETADILQSILEIIQIICNLVNIYELEYDRKQVKEDFQIKFAKSFSQHFVVHFPYSQADTTSRRGILNDREVNDPACVYQNLLVVYLYLVLHSSVEQGKLLYEYDEKIFAYLKPCIIKWNNKDNCNNILSIILPQLFSVKCHRIKKSSVLSILRVVIEGFNGNMFLGSFGSTVIFNILSDVASNDHINGSAIYQFWLENLPQLFCNEYVSSNVLDVTAKFCRQNNQTVLRGVRNNMNRIVETFNYYLHEKQVNDKRKAFVDNILPYTHPSFVDLETEIENN